MHKYINLKRTSQLFPVLWYEALWEKWEFGIYWGLWGCQAVFPRAFDYSL